MIKWTKVFDEEPDSMREVVAVSPNGVAHITSWRDAYGVFCCQGKRDDSLGWKWAYIF